MNKYMGTRTVRVPGIVPGIVILIFICAGCAGLASWSELKEGEYYDRPREFRAVVPSNWMKLNHGEHFLITRDGVALNQIVVSRHLLSEDLAFTKKKFTNDMPPQDLAEVEIGDIHSNPNVSKVDVLENTPLLISGHPGFRMVYQYKTKAGLKVKGIRAGCLSGDHVYRIIYEAPLQHYFPATELVFEQFLTSFKIVN